MDKIQQGIITLLKSAITGECYALPEGFSLDEAMDQIKRHHVIPLCYDGALRCGISAKEPLMKQLFAGYCQSLLKSEAQLREVERVCTAFDENGIDYMPLKGCNMKALYPKHELRVMGDADILIRNEQRPEIVKAMNGLGFENTENSDHELVWKSSALYLELHKHLVPSYNQDLYSFFGDGWRLAKHEVNNRFRMSPEDEYLYVFIHFLKHYRDGGIGLRHMTDLWLFRRTYPELDISYIETKLENFSLLTFYKNILRTISVWFEDAELDEKSAFITDVIFASGSFGSLENRAAALSNRSVGEDEDIRSAKLRYFIKTLFPPVKAIEGDYPILETHPRLLPVVWVYRPFYKLLFERHDVKKQLRFMNSMSQENLDSHRRQLEYVGLDPKY